MECSPFWLDRRTGFFLGSITSLPWASSFHTSQGRSWPCLLRDILVRWSVIPGLLITCPLPFPLDVFFLSSWPQREAQSPPCCFLGQVEGRFLPMQKTPLAIGKEPGCVLNTISNVIISRKKDQEEKQREKILFGYNWRLQFSTSVLFMNAPETRQQQWLIQYASCRKTIRKKMRVFNKHLERL